jgi:hypothetical protein
MLSERRHEAATFFTRTISNNGWPDTAFQQFSARAG